MLILTKFYNNSFRYKLKNKMHQKANKKCLSLSKINYFCRNLMSVFMFVGAVNQFFYFFCVSYIFFKK